MTSLTFLGQPVRYLVVGIGVTMLDFMLYAGLTRGFAFWQRHYLLANVLVFVTVATVSFFLNRRWTFRSPHRYALAYVRFLVVTTVGLTLVQVLLFFGVEYFKILDVLVKAVSYPIVSVFQYAAHRRWTFVYD